MTAIGRILKEVYFARGCDANVLEENISFSESLFLLVQKLVTSEAPWQRWPNKPHLTSFYCPLVTY